VDHVRLFRNLPAVRWRYRVHEQILPAVRAAGGRVRWSDVVIAHTGYTDPALRRRKLQRDLRLLHLENEEHPGDPFTLFNLGSIYQELGRHADALPLLRQSLAKSHPNDSIVRKLYSLIVSCHRAVGQPVEAAAACSEGLRVCPDDTELLFLDSVLRKDCGDAAGSEACLLRLLHERPAAHFASVDAGLRGHKALHNLAVLCFQQGRFGEAEARWLQAVAQRGDFVPSWVGLGECLLHRGAWEQAEAVAVRLEGLRDGPLEAALLRGRGHLMRREFAAAHALLDLACARYPLAVAPRVLLSHVLLQENKDLAGAEMALRAVLELVPGNAEARHNLALLQAQRQTQGPAAPRERAAAGLAQKSTSRTQEMKKVRKKCTFFFRVFVMEFWFKVGDRRSRGQSARWP
jgi:tetratricopeptide (TPR) repeat protein